MQILQRKYTTQLMQPGKPEKREQEYIRHGTRVLLEHQGRGDAFAPSRPSFYESDMPQSPGPGRYWSVAGRRRQYQQTTKVDRRAERFFGAQLLQSVQDFQDGMNPNAHPLQHFCSRTG
jgi:hypothetical protein